ncbi:RHS repeat domain-containing protein [Mucilaginibacter angelicae]
MGGIEFEDPANTGTCNLSFIRTDEGRVFTSGTTASYEYNLSDHLGSARFSFSMQTNTPTVTQTDDYYPFGLEIPCSLVASPKNEYLYNHKELQEETGLYDYGARYYDPLIGRLNTVDNKAEKYQGISSYAYAVNNPLVFLDPDGNDIVWFNQKGEEIGRKESQTEFRTLVATRLNPEYVKGKTAFYIYKEAKMPGVITKTIDKDEKGNAIGNPQETKFQEHDYEIAAQTFLFNKDLKEDNLEIGSKYEKGSDASTPLDVNLVKAWIYKESRIGKGQKVATEASDLLSMYNTGDKGGKRT